jgi:PKD repeat protein
VNHTVTVVNLPPVANFTFSPANGYVTTTFTFNSTVKDPDGTIAAYNWSFGDGTYSDKVMPEHRFSDDLTYHVTLRIRDDLGVWSPNFTRDVVIWNHWPLAMASPETQTIWVNTKANFTANGTTDPDNNITELTFRWFFGDWTAWGSGMQVSHVYTKAGEYNVTLNVSDDKGQYNEATVHVIVKAPVKPPKPKQNNAAAGIAVILIIVLVLCGIAAYLFMRRKKGEPEPVARSKNTQDDEAEEPEGAETTEAKPPEGKEAEGPIDEDRK